MIAGYGAPVGRRGRRAERAREQLLAQFRTEQIEPPTVGRLLRMVRSAAAHRRAELDTANLDPAGPAGEGPPLDLIDVASDAEAEVDDKPAVINKPLSPQGRTGPRERDHGEREHA